LAARRAGKIAATRPTSQDAIRKTISRPTGITNAIEELSRAANSAPKAMPRMIPRTEPMSAVITLS
jgi:hypothetical protein